MLVINQRYEREDTVRFYNDDGSQWYKFTFFYDDRDGKFDYPNPRFLPLEFDVDEMQLALAVIAERGDGYTITVNSTTGLRKHVRKEHFFSFLTWEQYVLKEHIVGFSPSTNPLHRDPGSNADTLPYRQGVLYEPVKLQGEWMQVKWEVTGATEYGWIRWHDKSSLLVYFLKD